MIKNSLSHTIKRNTILLLCASLFSACQNGFELSSNDMLSSFEEWSSISNTPLPDCSEDMFPPVLPSVEENPDVWNTENIDVSYIDPTKKLISFTFDDSPSKTLENIFAVFASFNETHPENKATATVFFNSYLFDSSTLHLLQTACALGFELGNHTHSHQDLTALDEFVLKEEIDKTDTALKKADGKERHLLRAPYGKTNEFVTQRVPAPLISWSIDTLDWTKRCADDIYNEVYFNRFDGAIVLMHDGYDNTIEALKRLLPDLTADGYQIVSVSALAKAHDVLLKKGNVYVRARKSKNKPTVYALK
ncbi:MAG: polysaccharide deacetylase family protein [Clostridia bacterium]|nr:polysaccharide deacetylase family protein [Clostridia bacterium]